MRVYLIRHGESFSNAHPEALALPDVEGDRLTERGKQQADEAGRYLAATEFASFITSPARRALETAEHVGTALGLGAEVEPIIHELREGSGYEALPPEQQRLQRWSTWMAEHGHDPDYAPPGGESFNDVIGRVRAFKRRLDEIEGPALVVTHGIFKRFFFIDSLLGDGFEAAEVGRLWQLGSVNAGVSVFEDTAANEKDPASGWRCLSWMERPWTPR
ncbi:MAG: alpha-ribazole phosphatase [Solirubrobacterales bacterium]|nr:alpha-ribazole phosphatase [Solirubrobacterales bacterium]